jgi:putative glycosyltransferase (TIGR04348 family)
MAAPAKPLVCIVTPGTREANNGNWRTAVRWAGLLRDRFRIILQSEWDATPADALIALHAGRSAASIRAFAERAPARPIALVLTGTDIYRDYPASAAVNASLESAHRIVALQPEALALLPAAHRAKAQVIFQSARALRRKRKGGGELRCVVVGHLRDEKDPRTLFAAVGQLPRALPISIRHIGAPLDAELGELATRLAQSDPRYRYEGAQPRHRARAAMQHAHLLVHPSKMEGGANVIVEAVTAGTPVMGSRIAGNIGMLGPDYAGYFPPGDSRALAALLEKAARDRRWLAKLEHQCAARRPLFAPSAEARAVNALVRRLLRGHA